ncbi:class I SAM-dependent methyltransferase [Streptomyces sp. AC550_RSS872]|uniref:class I SAM-dependent DNA methyltransferase n=1 Tax=Streptomyces sp. AC550_RSS872 TaxID=2823689 RepID=UPI001C27EEC9|nr:class I SAM-dependent methyltransferase [Streptomyces sp. AC550_RSS872]
MSAENPEFIRATRISYDTIADAYAERFSDWLGVHPTDRALLGAFAELVTARGGGPVADIGCGPGQVSAALDVLGVPVFGVDLSPRMVELARRAHPGLRFHVGSMTSLDLPNETLGGIVALYSVIHVPDGHLPTVFAEFHRVLVPGGHVLLGFQSGSPEGDEEHLHLTERFGHEISLDYFWHTPDAVAAHLAKADLQLQTRVLREPAGEEKRPRAFVLARKRP